jgi:hypothetical protein
VNLGSTSPRGEGAYIQIQACSTTTPGLHTRLKLRPQDSSAVSTRFLSAENIFRMLM